MSQPRYACAMCVPVAVSVCVPVSVYMPVCLSVCLCNIWNAKSTPASLSLSVSPINTAKARGRIAESPQYHKRIIITYHGHAHNAHMTGHHAHNRRNYCLLVCACACILLMLPAATAQGYCDPSLCPGGARHVVCGNSGVSSDTIVGRGQRAVGSGQGAGVEAFIVLKLPEGSCRIQFDVNRFSQPHKVIEICKNLQKQLVGTSMSYPVIISIFLGECTFIMARILQCMKRNMSVTIKYIFSE